MSARPYTYFDQQCVEMRRQAFVALRPGPATLTQLCAALARDGESIHRDLKQLARMGLVAAKLVQTYTPKIPVSIVVGRARVTWYRLTHPAPAPKVLQEEDKTPKPLKEPRGTKPWSNARREPTEILAMLAGRTNYLTPNEGRSTDGSKLTPLDVAHAIAGAKDKFGAAVALAVACQRNSEWPKVHALGYTPIVRELRRQRKFPGVIAGPLKHRARIVLWDAFHDLIKPKQRLSIKKAAKAARIAEEPYRFLHKHITGYLQDHANTAAGEACYFLFAPIEYANGNHALVLTDDDGKVQVLHAINALELMIAIDERTAGEDREKIAVLLSEISQACGKSRTVGVLRLRGVAHSAVYVNPTEVAA